MKKLLLLLILFTQAVFAGNVEKVKYHIVMKGEVDEKFEANFMSQAQKLMAKGKSKVNVYIDSTGGDVAIMMDIVYVIMSLKDKGYKFECKAKEAMSAAFTILQLCDKRILFKNSNLMQHQVRSTIGVTPMTKLYDDFRYVIDMRRVRIPESQWRQRTSKDYYITPHEALKLNVADEVMENIEAI